jgi:hypothetical protein
LIPVLLISQQGHLAKVDAHQVGDARALTHIKRDQIKPLNPCFHK